MGSHNNNMQEPIVFYDIPSNVKGTSWSGNTLKTK